jgi:hypothetical protein
MRVTSRALNPAARKNLSLIVVQVLVLCALCGWAYRQELRKVVAQATSMAEAAHTLAFPFLAALMIHGRRRVLTAKAPRPSIWGIAIVLLSIFAYAATTWPFDFGYLRRLQFVSAAAGIVLAVGGWRILWHMLPIIVLLFFALPLGWNAFAGLTIRPETLTLEMATAILHRVLGIFVELRGSDIHYEHQGIAGVIALGDPHRGFVIPIAHACLILFRDVCACSSMVANRHSGNDCDASGLRQQSTPPCRSGIAHRIPTGNTFGFIPA